MEPSILSLIPPVLTLVIALWSKNIMLALFLGIVSCSIYTGGIYRRPPLPDARIR